MGAWLPPVSGLAHLLSRFGTGYRQHVPVSEDPGPIPSRLERKLTIMSYDYIDFANVESSDSDSVHIVLHLRSALSSVGVTSHVRVCARPGSSQRFAVHRALYLWPTFAQR